MTDPEHEVMTVVLCRDAVRGDADEDGSCQRAVAVPRRGGTGDARAHAVHAHLFRHPVQEAGAPDVHTTHGTPALTTSYYQRLQSWLRIPGVGLRKMAKGRDHERFCTLSRIRRFRQF